MKKFKAFSWVDIPLRAKSMTRRAITTQLSIAVGCRLTEFRSFTRQIVTA
jgi:hypothetical protein